MAREQTRHVLAADVGGTKTRVALFSARPGMPSTGSIAGPDTLLAEIDRRAGASDEARRKSSQARALVDELSAPLVKEFQQEFRALGERLEVDPLGAHR